MRLPLGKAKAYPSIAGKGGGLLWLAASFCAPSFAADYSSPYGEWRGQAQYQAFVRTSLDPASHAVVDLVIAIDPGGKITGASTENGCRLLGLASPGSASIVVSLDVTLSKCTYASFNRVYRGNLTVYSKDGYAKLQLQALDVGSGRAGTYNIAGTMRR